MKKILLLLASLTCMSLSAGLFEEICHISHIPDGTKRWDDDCSLFFSCEILLNRLLYVAQPSNAEHEQVIRRIVRCAMSRAMPIGSHTNPRVEWYMQLDTDALSYNDFLVQVKPHLYNRHMCRQWAPPCLVAHLMKETS